MQNFDEVVKIIDSRVEALVAVYLFGSFATDSSNSESDVDFAIVAKGMISGQKLIEIKDILSSKINRGVDLVDLRDVPLSLAVQIIHDGKILLNKDAKEIAFLEVTLMSRYMNLNEERKGILEDIEKRGKVYG